MSLVRDGVVGDPGMRLRQAFGRFATGVCVVVAPGRAGPVGITINSFSSVSLEPPLALWSIDRGSDRFAAFLAAERFCINVLAGEQQAISARLARKGEGAFADGELRPASDGFGDLRLAGALASLECSAVQRIEAGDHVVLIGRIEAFEAAPERAPLLYFSGRYRALAPLPEV